MANQEIHSLVANLYSKYLAINNLHTGETDVSAGNVRVPLNFNEKEYRFLDVQLNSLAGNPGANRARIFLPMAAHNIMSSSTMPVQFGTTTAWVRLECNSSGLLIVSFGGVSSLYITGVNGIGIIN